MQFHLKPAIAIRTSQSRFSRNSTTRSSIKCRSLIPKLTQIGQKENTVSRNLNSLTPQVMYGWFNLRQFSQNLCLVKTVFNDIYSTQFMDAFI